MWNFLLNSDTSTHSHKNIAHPISANTHHRARLVPQIDKKVNHSNNQALRKSSTQSSRSQESKSLEFKSGIQDLKNSRRPKVEN